MGKWEMIVNMGNLCGSVTKMAVMIYSLTSLKMSVWKCIVIETSHRQYLKACVSFLSALIVLRGCKSYISLKNLVYHQSSNTKTLRHTHTYRFYVQIPFRRNWRRVPMDGPSCCVCVCSFSRQGFWAAGHFLLQGIFPTGDRTVSCISCIGRWIFSFFNHWHHLGSLNPAEFRQTELTPWKRRSNGEIHTQTPISSLPSQYLCFFLPVH